MGGEENTPSLFPRGASSVEKDRDKESHGWEERKVESSEERSPLQKKNIPSARWRKSFGVISIPTSESGNLRAEAKEKGELNSLKKEGVFH